MFSRLRFSYQSICRPLQALRWSVGRSVTLLAVCYALSALFATPQLFLWDWREDGYGTEDCRAYFPAEWVGVSYVLAYCVLTYFLPLAFLCWAYGALTLVIVRRKNIGEEVLSLATGEAGATIKMLHMGLVTSKRTLRCNVPLALRPLLSDKPHV